MKKVVLVLLLSVTFLLSACTLIDNKETDSPLNIVVDSGVFQCDEYENAIAYEIELASPGETVTYEVSNLYDLNYLLENGTYTLRVRALLGEGTYSDYSNPITVNITESLNTSVLAGESLHDQDYITIHGRTLYDSATQIQNLYYTASGFDIEFYGTSLDITLTSDNATIANKRAYVSVVIDNEEAPFEGTTYVLSQSEILLRVAQDLEEGFHTISLYKINESLDNNIGIKRIRTDGFFVEPEVDDTQLKIQYIGASTTTGYGNMATSATAGKTSESSNGLLAFTSLSAYMLEAQWSITSASGWGVTRGWNTGGVVSTVNNIPNAYNYVAINSSGQVLDELWDQTQYQPDVYVVNLGSNDYNAGGYAYMTQLQKEEFDEMFVTEFTDFILQLHEYAPDAIIIVTYGILSKLDVIETLTLESIEQAQLQYAEIYALEMQTGTDLGFPYGANYHPNVLTHIAGAEVLAERIAELTGYSIVHEEIVLPS